MKHSLIFSLLFLLLLTISCNKQNTNSNEPSGIVEENDMCICTEEYAPVCGENGKTYPNSCHAGCDKVKATPGECSK